MRFTKFLIVACSAAMVAATLLITGCSTDNTVAKILDNPSDSSSQYEGYILGGREDVYELVSETLPVYDESFDRDVVIYAYANRDPLSPIHQIDIEYHPSSNSYYMYFDNEGNRQLFSEFESDPEIAEKLIPELTGTSDSIWRIQLPNAVLHSEMNVDSDGFFYVRSDAQHDGYAVDVDSVELPVVSYLYGHDDNGAPMYEDFLFHISGDISDPLTLVINTLSYSTDGDEYNYSIAEPMAFDYIGRLDPK